MPGKSHGLRILVGYSPWGRKESDTTERLHFTSEAGKARIVPSSGGGWGQALNIILLKNLPGEDKSRGAEEGATRARSRTRDGVLGGEGKWRGCRDWRCFLGECSQWLPFPSSTPASARPFPFTRLPLGRSCGPGHVFVFLCPLHVPHPSPPPLFCTDSITINFK